MPGEILRKLDSTARPVLWRNAKPLSGTQRASEASQREFETANRLELARRDGFASGVAAANQEAEQELLPAIQKVAGAVAELAELRENIREHATNDVVQLAITIASRVVCREVAVDPDILAGLLRAAFSKLKSQEISRARVHAGFETSLRRCLDQNKAGGNLLVLADRNLKPGEVAFECGVKLDASVEADLSEIDRGMSDRLAK
ncbi:MAG TPA: FliH/SctL family protein [Bryobacteraceae bacterium]|nr:FliH/SctL family protein [Bryobacteraceae bacterium]